MLAISLQSGSSGNCIYVETGSVKLLFDAGICGAEAERRLAALGRDIRQVNGLVISHDHADHVKYAGIYQRKYGVPIYATPRTLTRAQERHSLGRLTNVNLFLAGGTINFGDVSVQTVPTPHDGADGAVFVVVSGGKRIGIMTDLGHAFDGLCRLIENLDGVFLESNYDPEMLASGPYPAFLKRRISGPGGHISNIESAELLREGRRLKWACLSHLSEKNNHPEVALKTHRALLDRDLELYTASRNAASVVLTV